MTATLDSDQIVVGGTGTIWVAPVGTSLPDTPSESLNAAFLSLGYTTEDGVKFTDEKTVKEIAAWQSFYPVRRIITARAAKADFTLMEFDYKTLPFAFGGGAWTEPSAGEYLYTPPDPGDIDERAMVIDVVDGLVNWRIVLPKGMVTSNTETKFVRSDAALLPITFSVLGQAAVDPWSLATDSPAADPAEAGS